MDFAANALINEKTVHKSVAHWIEHLNDAGVPCGRILNLAEVFADPQVLAQDMVFNVEHPGVGTVRMTGFPVKLSDTPAQLHLPAPTLGAHSTSILQELGYTAEQIAAWRDAGVV